MDSLLVTTLTTLGYAFPELLACGVALAMLWASARPGKPRHLGLAGVGLMLACALLQFGLGLYQNWVIQAAADTATRMETVFAWLGAARMLVNCISLVGLLLVVRGLCVATQPGPLR